MVSTEYENLTVGVVPSDVLVVKVVSPGTTTVDVVIAGMHTVTAVAHITIWDNGDRVATSDVDVTVDGNTVTIADGGSYSLTDSHVIWLTVIGNRRT